MDSQPARRHIEFPITAIAISLALALSALAQQNGPSPAPFTEVSQHYGVCEVTDDEALWGLGPNYKIRFGSERVDAMFAAGPRAPSAPRLGLRLDRVFRRRGPELPLAQPERVHTATTVHFDRGPVTEVYELRESGVEQSFVFDSLPTGRGDLIVRLELDTDLMPTHTGIVDTIDFVMPETENAGIHVGAVTGIDAEGRRASGTLHVSGESLELVLPAKFVDHARLPLVLDPFLTSRITVAAVSAEYRPDIAFDPASQLYLAVWERRFSSNDIDIVGQRISASGALIGPPLALEPGTPVCGAARVASVAPQSTFVVVWGCNTDVAGCIVSASSGSIGNFSIASGPDVENRPDIGGSRHGSGACGVAQPNPVGDSRRSPRGHLIGPRSQSHGANGPGQRIERSDPERSTHIAQVR